MQKLNLKMQTLNFPDTYWLALIGTKKTLKKEEVIEILLQNQNKFFCSFRRNIDKCPVNEEYQKMNGSAKDNRVKVVLGNFKLWVHFLEFEYEPTIETLLHFRSPMGWRR